MESTKKLDQEGKHASSEKAGRKNYTGSTLLQTLLVLSILKPLGGKPLYIFLARYKTEAEGGKINQ